MTNTIGLPKGTVSLLPHHPSWHMRYMAEARLLQKKLDISNERIQHVGSTAIPGILAKPIIDIAICVESLATADAWAQALAAIGYWNKGPQPDMPERRFFAKGPVDNRTVYLHVVTSQEYKRLLQFRNILRANLAVAKEYSVLKARLAIGLANDRAQYTRLKSSFIQKVLQQATIV